MSARPLLLVGHDRVDATGVAELRALTARLRRRLAGVAVDVDGGFLELSRPAGRGPTVHAAWTALADRGHRTMAAVPLVLLAAGHAEGDIPAALEREARRDPATDWLLARSLGPHPVLQEILAARITAAGAGSASSADTAVLLVGRGSTDPAANAEVCKVARLLQEGRPYAFVEPAFVSLALPDVPGGLARCRALGARRVVVAPYFLFDGVLPRRVGEQARAYAAAHPDLDVRVADPLGDTERLADLVVERYREVLDGDLRTNCDTCAHRELRPGAPAAAHGHGHAHA